MKKIKGFNVSYEKTLLKSGSSVYLFYRENAPISIRLVFNAGSRMDNGSFGLAHFTEHLLLGGTDKYKTKKDLADAIQNLGARFNAKTNNRRLIITFDIAEKRDLKELLGIIDEIVNNSIFTEETIEKEREVILSEISKKKSNPQRLIDDLQQELLMQDTELAHSALGTLESVKKISRNEIVSFYEKNIKNGHVLYMISGDVEQGFLEEELEKINLSRRDYNESDYKTYEIIENKKTNIVLNELAEQNYFSLSVRLKPITAKEDLVCASLFSDYLGNSQGSLLKKKLRFDLGLVYDISSWIVSDFDSSYISIKTNCKTENTERVIKEINTIFNSLGTIEIKNDQLELSKKNYRRNAIFSLQDISSWVDLYHLKNVIYTPDNPMLIDEILETIESITVEKMESFIKSFLTEKELLISGFGKNIM